MYVNIYLFYGQKRKLHYTSVKTKLFYGQKFTIYNIDRNESYILSVVGSLISLEYKKEEKN